MLLQVIAWLPGNALCTGSAGTMLGLVPCVAAYGVVVVAAWLPPVLPSAGRPTLPLAPCSCDRIVVTSSVPYSARS